MKKKPRKENEKMRTSDNEVSKTIPSEVINYTDPATWKNCDHYLRQILVEHGPIQITDFDFLKNKEQRKFSVIHYKRQLVNGENICRQWLQYSVSEDAIFFFCCKLFSATKGSTLSSKGSNDWKIISAILANHEKSHDHVTRFQTWKEFELRLEKKMH